MKAPVIKLSLNHPFVLYFVLMVALANLLYLSVEGNMAFAAIFLLIGFLTSFFSKNMTVILVIAIVATNVLQFGSGVRISEGLENKKDDDEAFTEGKNDEDEAFTEGNEDEKKSDEKKDEKKSDEKKDEKKSDEKKSEDKKEGMDAAIDRISDRQEKIAEKIKKIEPLVKNVESFMDKLDKFSKY